MAYTIDRYNNTELTVIEDGTIDQSTDLKLVGKNYAGYGEIQNENFVFLLENFAGSSEPPRAISGQLWFDSEQNKLKFYDGVNWRATGGAEVGASQPSGLTEGDFWWDSANEQLYSYNGTEFVLIGPQSAGSGQTQIISRTVRDTNENGRGVITGVVNDDVVFVVSSQQFDLFEDEDLRPEFDRIRPGITLRNTTSTSGGVTSGDYVIYGTASSAKGLVDTNGVFYSTNQFVKTNNATFTGSAIFQNSVNVGPGTGDLKLRMTGNVAEILNDGGQQLSISVRDSFDTLRNSVRVTSSGIIPGIDANSGLPRGNVSIGATDFVFDKMYAKNYDGLALVANKLYLGDGVQNFDRTNDDNWKSASTSATPDTVVVRTADSIEVNGVTYDPGSIRAAFFIGTATSAQYADLAEVYSTDQKYPVGTVMMICEHDTHEAEAISSEGHPIGVISEKPAYIMNAEAEGQAIGLKGRVPVRIIGSVKKGQPVYVGGNGTASVQFNGRPMVGIALETNSNEEEKLVECVLKV